MPRAVNPFALEIDNSDSAKLTFHLGDLRPRDRVELDEFSLMVGEPLEGTITAGWQATSTSVDGVQEGTIDFQIAERALTPMNLVPYEDETAGEGETDDQES